MRGTSTPTTVVVEDVASGDLIDLTRAEDDAFWAWAVIETFRHTGVRIEELLEITHLALISYTLPDTGEIVPLLQIVPSKTDQEWLLLVTPELASVLASIIHRVRGKDGRVSLVSRYDEHERVTGPALPHLFRHGFRHRHVQESANLRAFADGRTPSQVFWDQHFLGNSRLAPCSAHLKQVPCRRWLTTHAASKTGSAASTCWSTRLCRGCPPKA